MKDRDDDWNGGLRPSAARLAHSSREMLRRVESFGLTGNWGWTFATGEQVWSLGLYGLLGLEPGIVRPGIETFLACVHPADRASVALAWNEMRYGVLGDRRFRIIRPNGAQRTMLGHSEIHHALDGRPIGAAGLLVDVTERERLDQARAIDAGRRLSLFRETGSYFSHIPMSPFDPYPPELLALTGKRREDFNENWLCAIPREEHGFWRGELMQSWAGTKPFTYLYTQIRADGERVRYRGTFAPILDASGGTEAWSAFTGPERMAVGPATGGLARALELSVAGWHLRAARALLDWSMTDLAKASGLSFSSIRRLEENADTSSARTRHVAIAALRRAGIRFALTQGNTIAVARL
ncbi:helix-turn-helix domain-containing protein [Methylobacterium segetis]|uniref:helix-turn-helix domain-containing protein n=1 Tax=Methylobacterium segetis TaxID=2488750 RepID=UPI00104473A2|nr:helix-turn-helix transcriptional regulator [Methylobacterium segetis]